MNYNSEPAITYKVILQIASSDKREFIESDTIVQKTGVHPLTQHKTLKRLEGAGLITHYFLGTPCKSYWRVKSFEELIKDGAYSKK